MGTLLQLRLSASIHRTNFRNAGCIRCCCYNLQTCVRAWTGGYSTQAPAAGLTSKCVCTPFQGCRNDHPALNSSEQSRKNDSAAHTLIKRVNGAAHTDTD
eukprot:scpid24760/ scgid35106/ 